MAGERFRRLLVPEVSMETSFTWQPSYVRPLEATLPKDLHGKEQVVRRYDRTMLALGNTDTKAAVLVYGLSSTPRNGQKIRDDLEAVLPADTWLPSATTLRLKYLRDGFCPTGIATEFDNSGRYFYATTTEGEGLPKDIAAFNLHYAANTNRSISSIFGNTTTPEDSGVRSYINRTALLLLLSRGQTYVSEIIRQTGMGTSTTGGNLAKLRDLGFVDYEFADTEVQGWGVYEKVGIPDQIVHSPINDRLRRNILEYYRLNTIGNPQTIIKALGRVDTIDVFQILSELVDAGFLKRSQWYGGVQQSDAKITAEGKRFVEEFFYL
ncbi:MAG: ArsR family transcriptional regulator, partial [Actinobacteria bacterium]|nr:ArsR family transcriptional regulator [Actinomycetota bacterium]